MKLQFELMTVATRERKKENSRVVHNVEQKVNINGFERNMKRLGVGNDDGMDDGEMRPTAESGLNYLTRLETAVGDAGLGPDGNFEVMENLHRAEKVNRRARKERETRRRKMQVEQENAREELQRKEAGRMMMEGMRNEADDRRRIAAGQWELRRSKERALRAKNSSLETKRVEREEVTEDKLREFFTATHDLSLMEPMLAAKAARQAEIDSIKAASAASKRRTATACATAAVAKLLDLVEVMCCERVDVGGPVAPQFYRDVKRCYVSDRLFFEEEVVRDDDEWTLREEIGGYVEGLAWKNGHALWGEVPPTPPLSFDVDPTIDPEVSTKIAANIKACLSSLSREYKSIEDYVGWTLYEYASYLRREDPKWQETCKKHRKIVRMETADNTDLDNIENAIDALEEDLGDVAEERADSNRDVCDGSSGRAKEWIAGVVAARSDNLRIMCKLTVESADAELASVLEREGVRRKEAERVAEEQRVKDEEAAAQLLEEKRLEEEAAAAALEEPPAKAAKESKGDEKARLEREEIEAEEARVAAAAAENARMAEENLAEKARQIEVERQQGLIGIARTALESSSSKLQSVFAAADGSSWLHTATTTDDGSIQLARSLTERISQSAAGFLEANDITSYFDCGVIMSRVVDALVRIEARNVSFATQAEEVSAHLCVEMDRLCVKRALFENKCIAGLAARLGKAAAAHWKESFQFRVDFSGEANVSVDARYPGLVFDSCGKNFSINFLVLMAKRFKDACKSNGTVSVESFVKIVQRSVEKEALRDGAVDGFGAWTGGESLRKIGGLMGGKTGRVPWRKFVHLCVCFTLPTICPVEELVRLSMLCKKIGISVRGSEGFYGLGKEDFMQGKLWFEEKGEKKGLDADECAAIKEIYWTAFSDENGELINMSQLLLALSCEGEGATGGGVECEVGLFRACCSFGVLGEGGIVGLDVGSGVVDCGPRIGLKGLEDMIKVDYVGEAAGLGLEFVKDLYKAAGGVVEEEAGTVSFGNLQGVLQAGGGEGWRGFRLLNLLK